MVRYKSWTSLHNVHNGTPPYVRNGFKMLLPTWETAGQVISTLFVCLCVLYVKE